MNGTRIPPMPLVRSLLFFVLPMLLMIGMFWGVIPLMDLMGVKLFIAFLTAFGLPMLVLFFLALRFYRKEGHPWTWHAFRDRFRLFRLTGADWVWTIALALFLLASQYFLSFTSEWFTEQLPKFMFRMFDEDPNYFMEVRFSGNWLLLVAMMIFVFVSVIGEELWFRGYVFPRQEISHAKMAWVVHGLLWSIFLAYMPWQFLRVLPGSLALAYVVQRTGNTWPAILAHCALYFPYLFLIVSRITK